jgi:hypothetical protein
MEDEKLALDLAARDLGLARRMVSEKFVEMD